MDLTFRRFDDIAAALLLPPLLAISVISLRSAEVETLQTSPITFNLGKEVMRNCRCLDILVAPSFEEVQLPQNGSHETKILQQTKPLALTSHEQPQRIFRWVIFARWMC